MRPAALPFFVAAALSLAPLQAQSCSICHASDPVLDTLGPEYAGPLGWTAAFEWERYDKAQTSEATPAAAPGIQFHGGHGHAAPLVESLVEHRFTVTLTRSLGARFSAVARFPWSDRRLESGGGGAVSAVENSDLSDPEFLAVVRAWPAPESSGSGVSLVAGVKTAWGKDDRSSAGIRLDEALQAGTGSTDWIGGGSAVLSTGAGLLYGSALFRATGTNPSGYEYGDVFLVSAGFERPLLRGLRASLTAQLRDAGVDREHGAGVPESGGRRLCLTPEATLAIAARSNARFAIQIPIAADLEGRQEEEPVVSAGVTHGF